MLLGKVENPETIDFRLPPDETGIPEIFESSQKQTEFKVCVGCAKWNRNDLKGFYPRGTKDELTYYASQFNSIELNATFYKIPGVQQVKTWCDKTPGDFKFFPKITNTISHFKRLNSVVPLVEEFCTDISNFETKLGMVFLQMPDNFTSKNFDRLKHFVETFPASIPLAVELRNTHWFNDPQTSSELYNLLEEKRVANIIVDTAGRRDLLHMRLTTPTAFVRWVGANHPSDYTRLDEWVERLAGWIETGLENLYFFIHQNIEKESPLLAAHFIKKLNERCGLNVRGPGKRTGFE